jgi:hypothetical protein
MQTRQRAHGEAHQRTGRLGRLRDGARVITRYKGCVSTSSERATRVTHTQQRLGIVENRPKDAHQRLAELVLKVVLHIDSNIVLQHVQWVLCQLVALLAFCALSPR